MATSAPSRANSTATDRPIPESLSATDFKDKALQLLYRPSKPWPRLLECNTCRRLTVVDDLREGGADKWYLPDNEDWPGKEFLRDYFAEALAKLEGKG